MGLINRITIFTAGLKAKASEVNAEFNVLFNLVNGNIDNANVDGSAAIEQSKIDHISDDDPAARADSPPGNSGSPAKTGSLESELQRLRYAQRQNSVGTSAIWFDSSGTPAIACGWQELPIRGPNLLNNSSFEYQTGGAGTAPDGWEFVGGTPTTAIIQITAVTEGTGNDLRIVTSGTEQGVEQTIRNVKEGAFYLIGARVKQSVGTVRINVDDDVVTSADYQSGDLDSTSPTYETKAMVVKVDTSISTGITPQFLGVASADDIKIDHAFMYELGTDPIGNDQNPLHIVTGSGNTLHRNPVVTPDSLAADETGTYCAVTVTTPSDRPCYIEVTGILCICADSNIDGTEVEILLEHADDGVPTWGTYATDSMLCPSTGQQNVAGTVPIHYIVEDPGFGEQHDFRISVENVTGSGGTVYINQIQTGIGAVDFESSLTAIVRSKL